jgi:hypothetical protein
MIGDNLKRLQPPAVFRAVSVLTVVDLGDDPGYVVVSDGSEDGEQPMACSSGYPYRAVGDSVLAVQLAGSAWQILGSMGATSLGSTPLTADSVAAMIAAVPDVTLTWGTGAPPGSGWTGAATSVFGRDDGNGDRSVYLQLASSSGAPSAKPGKTASTTIYPDDHGSWRHGLDQQNDDVKVGDWPGGPNADWYGGWFYGTALADACAGKTGITMQIRIARRNSNNGYNRGIRTHLAVHNKQTRSKPSLTDDWDGPKLSRGGSAWVSIPASQVADLAAGTKRGVGATGEGYSQHLVYATSCGQIKISYSA